MRRLLALFGTLGGVVLLRRRARRRPAPVLAPEPAVGSRAEELRQRLDESRALVGEREAFEEAETPVDEAEPASGPDDRRRRVHDQGRSAVERMRGSADS